jgi:hypothetical protein
MQTAESGRAAAPPAPSAIYKFCGCLAKQPGRACARCWDFRWLKSCADCLGLGTLNKSSRPGAQDRMERCGRCMGQGWTPCPKREISDAERQEARRKAEAEEEEFDQTLGLTPGASAAGAATETPVARSPARRSVLRRNQSRRKPKPLPAALLAAEPAPPAQLAQYATTTATTTTNISAGTSPFAAADLESPFAPRDFDPEPDTPGLAPDPEAA